LWRLKQSRSKSVPFTVVVAIPSAESAPDITQRVISFRICSFYSFLKRIA
jgi:hypothetical protein